MAGGSLHECLGNAFVRAFVCAFVCATQREMSLIHLVWLQLCEKKENQENLFTKS